jgi:hypothetical protein
VFDQGLSFVCSLFLVFQTTKVVRHIPDPDREQLIVRKESRLKDSMHGDLEAASFVSLFDFAKEKGSNVNFRVFCNSDSIQNWSCL